MTPEQRELARHALGLPNKDRRSYRNYFATGPDGPDFGNWQSMAYAGDAVLRGLRNSVFGELAFFALTRKGAEAALNPRESLCTEDFPIGETSHAME